MDHTNGLNAVDVQNLGFEKQNTNVLQLNGDKISTHVYVPINKNNYEDIYADEEKKIHE